MEDNIYRKYSPEAWLIEQGNKWNALFDNDGFPEDEDEQSDYGIFLYWQTLKDLEGEIMGDWKPCSPDCLRCKEKLRGLRISIGHARNRIDGEYFEQISEQDCY